QVHGENKRELHGPTTMTLWQPSGCKRKAASSSYRPWLRRRYKRLLATIPIIQFVTTSRALGGMASRGLENGQRHIWAPKTRSYIALSVLAGWSLPSLACLNRVVRRIVSSCWKVRKASGNRLPCERWWQRNGFPITSQTWDQKIRAST